MSKWRGFKLRRQLKFLFRLISNTHVLLCILQLIVSKILPCDENNVTDDFLEWFVNACQRLENDLRALSDSGMLSYEHQCFTPPAMFIRNHIRDLSDVFSISSLVKVLMTSFPDFHGCLCKQWGWLYNKKENYTVLKTLLYSPAAFVRKIHHLKIKFISSSHHVISSL